jgi:hypothetical protein
MESNLAKNLGFLFKKMGRTKQFSNRMKWATLDFLKLLFRIISIVLFSNINFNRRTKFVYFAVK